ncbi:MAG: hypothetical protein K9W42_04945 [Candidatus Heimdallarchaeota archaeon]|nr:hypothetical protein [Candidatus Heimdallarchaeota archaeon]
MVLQRLMGCLQAITIALGRCNIAPAIGVSPSQQRTLLLRRKLLPSRHPILVYFKWC